MTLFLKRPSCEQFHVELFSFHITAQKKPFCIYSWRKGWLTKLTKQAMNHSLQIINRLYAAFKFSLDGPIF